MCRTASISSVFSLTCEVNQSPSSSRISAPADSSSGAVHDSEKRGVTAYRLRPTPCQRFARSSPSENARSEGRQQVLAQDPVGQHQART